VTRTNDATAELEPEMTAEAKTLKAFVSAYYLLEQSYAGVANPEEMGTTGLIGWTITGGSQKQAFNRARRAIRIVRSRRGSAEGFSRAVLAAIPNKAQCERFAGYFRTIFK
jgi:hypothetical protein